ncbi:MAG: HAD-IIA family hydrolase [Chloroflexota bacterium]
MNNLKNLILDMDGVLWRGETPMPGLATFFATLQDARIKYVLATNNATKIAPQYSEKLQRFGVNIPSSAILTSAEATAAYLADQLPPGAAAYVVGEAGLRQALEAQGFNVLPESADGHFAEPHLDADVVVVSFTRHACYRHLATAVHLINHGALFVGTNPDVTFPHEFGPMPGAGAYLAFIEAATNQQPTIVGKPGRAIFDEALSRLGAAREETAMVGDRLETDIAGAQAAGLKTIMLLSGVTNRQKLESSDVKPDFVYDNIEDLTSNLLRSDGHIR